MMLVLGILIGLLLAVLVLLATRRFQVPIERTISQLENKVKEKGAIFIEEDANRELDQLIDGLPKE